MRDLTVSFAWFVQRQRWSIRFVLLLGAAIALGWFLYGCILMGLGVKNSSGRHDLVAFSKPEAFPGTVIHTVGRIEYGYPTSQFLIYIKVIWRDETGHRHEWAWITVNPQGDLVETCVNSDLDLEGFDWALQDLQGEIRFDGQRVIDTVTGVEGELYVPDTPPDESTHIPRWRWLGWDASAKNTLFYAKYLLPSSPVIPIAALTTLLMILTSSRVTARVTRRPDVCIQCGYSLRGIVSGQCPECGRAFAQQNSHSES